MNDTWLLLPDFALIALGWLVCRYTALNRPLWDGVERLVYFLLFPALLFNSVARSAWDPASMARLAGAGLALTAAGIAAASALRGWPRVDPRLHAAGAQTAYRFNTYVALALAERLAGTRGLASMAMLVATCVPLANVAAVWPLARQGGHPVLRELARNPLILASLAGLAWRALDLPLPALAATTLARLSTAALPLGLMAVGAGIRIGALGEGPGLAAALMAIRHALLPALALAMVTQLPLAPAQQAVLMAFGAMPTASSAYVLAVRMGGHGAYAAGLVSLSTLLGMASIPLWLAAWHAVGT
ncbi:MAG: AEC family transporter [Burkholderiales bacterium]|nr:AEC family transporter [Burkholderiales bacterium]MDE1929705.1 AEC family transporter [Burkholderiales bacterium]MDE2158708.1 AEC family transporter [Burkholderiales bacterium]MDE2503742.1 AEC family transporter [Burkholderiales bacterium]